MNNTFYSDKPISSTGDDLLKRKSFAELLARSLINLNNDDTFTVGLFGKWGSGKTSLVNMTLQEIENHKSKPEQTPPIIVHFEPWNFTDTTQLLSQFLIRLANEFRSKEAERSTEIAKKIETYSYVLESTSSIPILGPLIAPLLKGTASLFADNLKKIDETDILKQKNYVIKILGDQPNNILVVIDDIDRLNNDQIRQVFQLITSVAKFPKTTYLVVFDKEIVVEALETLQKGSGEEYLEKIIQMPIQIPPIPKSELREILFNRLDTIAGEHKDTSMVFSQEYWQELYTLCISPFIKNIREVNRLCNVVRFKLSAIASEVNFVDMVVISMIEICFPALYEWIKDNKACLTGEIDIRLIKKSHKEKSKFYESQITSFLEQKNLKEDLDRYVETAVDILAWLFPNFGKEIGSTHQLYRSDASMKNNQITHPEKFDRYFHLSLYSNDLKRGDILTAIQKSDQESFQKYLLQTDKDGTSYDFLEEVNAMMSEISADRAKIIAKALFETSSQLNTKSSGSILELGATEYAQFLIPRIIEKIPETDRMNFISECLAEATHNSIPTIAHVINIIELSWGRLAANGDLRGDCQIVTIDELQTLENEFCEKVKTSLETIDLFDLVDCDIIFYLLKSFDPEYIKTYLKNAFETEENIFKYLERTKTIGRARVGNYIFDDEDEYHLIKDSVIPAINSKIESQTISDLSEKTQNRCAAFLLHSQNPLKNIFPDDIDEMISSWQKKRDGKITSE